MVDKKNIFLLLLIVFGFLGGQRVSTALESKANVPDKIEVRRYTSFYTQSGHGYNLKEFNRADNNPILNACLTGATYKELKELGVDNLLTRLEKLQKGKIVKKVNDYYYLAFPTIVGKKRAKLQKLVEQTALQLLPTSENMIEQILPHLERNEMLYHVLWSVVMDGSIAWNTVKNELQERIKKGNTSIKNTAWLIYPRHPYTCGTNSYGGSDSQIIGVIITWNSNSPEPSKTHRNISKYEKELIQSYAQERPVEGAEARETLALYGLLNEKGIAKAHIVDVNSEAAQTYKTLASHFAHQFMTLCDIEKVANLLDATPGQALLIAYHEVCYEILKQLVTKGTLKIPEKAEKNQMHRLITFVTAIKELDIKKK
ncbi:MAG TPA: hypothetical protein ENH34_06095 [Phycisphaerales bacterium]|nr:hypothetical protein [Phycisphaerales bacterium]